MKNKILAAVLLSVSALTAYVAIGGSTAYLPLNSQAIATSQVIVPEVKRVTNLWETSTAYIYGDYISSSGKTYFCISAGTSSGTATDAPNVNDGDDTLDPAVTWRFVRQQRDHLAIQNDSSGPIWIGTRGAETNKGIRLNGNGGSITWDFPDAPQGEISAITIAATNNVLIQER